MQSGLPLVRLNQLSTSYKHILVSLQSVQSVDQLHHKDHEHKMIIILMQTILSTQATLLDTRIRLQKCTSPDS